MNCPPPEFLRAVNVLTLAQIAGLRRLLHEGRIASTTSPIPLDDFLVKGEIGVALYSDKAPGDAGEADVWLRYMTPDAARRLQREVRA
jgi:hypothetical protein